MSDIENLQDELHELLDKAEEIQFNIDNNSAEYYDEDGDDFEEWRRRAKFALMKTRQSVRRIRSEIKHKERENKQQAKIEEARAESERKDEFNAAFVSLAKDSLNRDEYLGIARLANKMVSD